MPASLSVRQSTDMHTLLVRKVPLFLIFRYDVARGERRESGPEISANDVAATTPEGY